MLFCEVCQTEVTEDSKDWLACYCIGYPKNDTENHPPFWRRRLTPRALDGLERVALHCTCPDDADHPDCPVHGTSRQ